MTIEERVARLKAQQATPEYKAASEAADEFRRLWDGPEDEAFHAAARKFLRLFDRVPKL